MKTTFRQLRTLGLAGLLLLPALPLRGQGTFQNLDFEHPLLPLVLDADFHVPLTNALPGWKGYVGPYEANRVLYNTLTLGAPDISFHGPGSGESPFHGRYCVVLQAGWVGGTIWPSAIAQTGQIPAWAQSLRFYAFNMAVLQVSFSGQALPVAYLAGNAFEYQEFGVNLSAFAGQTGELRFSGGSGNLDYIQFSAEAIPEPGSLGLLGAGVLVLGRRFWRRTA